MSCLCEKGSYNSTYLSGLPSDDLTVLRCRSGLATARYRSRESATVIRTEQRNEKELFEGGSNFKMLCCRFPENYLSGNPKCA